MQANWIGRSVGCRGRFPLIDDAEGRQMRGVHDATSTPSCGATFMVLAPEHPLVGAVTTPERRDEVEAYVAAARRETDIERLSTEREKSGVHTGGYATNPVNGEAIPIWVADYVLGHLRHRRGHGRARAR